MECSWPTLCTSFTCYPPGEGPLRPNSSWGECFSSVSRQADRYKHVISSDYTFTVKNSAIPIVNTDRRWNASFTANLSVPTSISKVYLTNDGTYWCMDGWTPESHTTTAKEECTITRSTLHYLDQRYGVCLYRKNIEQIKFDVTTAETNLWKTPYNTILTGSCKLFGGSKKNYNNDCFEEWHLIIDGVDKILCSTKYCPLPELSSYASDGSDILFDPNYKGIDELELIIPIMPSTSSAQLPWDDELRFHGYYSYRGGPESPNWQADGVCADFFYPAWCRGLQEDPFWAYARDNRYASYISPEIPPLVTNKYVPPPITVDPIPVGSFVRLPDVRDVYQFLITRRDSSHHLESSESFEEIVRASLAKNGVTPANGTALYYPIGVF